jgi:hypothetical protein
MLRPAVHPAHDDPASPDRPNGWLMASWHAPTVERRANGPTMTHQHRDPDTSSATIDRPKGSTATPIAVREES